jgi:hypothetical protein
MAIEKQELLLKKKTVSRRKKFRDRRCAFGAIVQVSWKRLVSFPGGLRGAYTTHVLEQLGTAETSQTDRWLVVAVKGRVCLLHDHVLKVSLFGVKMKS